MQCTLWVISGHVQRKRSCPLYLRKQMIRPKGVQNRRPKRPLYPRKRTFDGAKQMSTKGQQRTLVGAVWANPTPPELRGASGHSHARGHARHDFLVHGFEPLSLRLN